MFKLPWFLEYSTFFCSLVWNLDIFCSSEWNFDIFFCSSVWNFGNFCSSMSKIVFLKLMIFVSKDIICQKISRMKMMGFLSTVVAIIFGIFYIFCSSVWNVVNSWNSLFEIHNFSKIAGIKIKGFCWKWIIFNILTFFSSSVWNFFNFLFIWESNCLCKNFKKIFSRMKNLFFF